MEIDGCRTQRGHPKWGISRDRRKLSYDKTEDGMEDVDASPHREERRREMGRSKKMEESGSGKRMLTDCKAISDPPPTQHLLDWIYRTHTLINT